MPDSELRERLIELEDLRRIGMLLSWDRQTQMPPRGVTARASAQATLDRISHARLTSPELGAALAAAAGREEPALLRVASRDREVALRVPAELVAAMSSAGITGHAQWERARAARDFSLFRPALQRNVELARRYASCFPECEHPYDALIDRYEPGASTAEVRGVLDTLAEGLVPLLRQIAEGDPIAPLRGPFDVAGQRQLALEMVREIGFADEAWRADDATHPFEAAIGREDVRVTSRFDPETLTGVFALLHEVGHGLYEHQIDPDLDGTTLGTGVSLGVHESQSRLWENQVGRSLPFWRHWFPRAQQLLPDALGALSVEEFYRHVNAVHPSLIRVEADEVTYSLHIVLRFELEVALVEGTLEVADLPAAWNARARELLGVDVPDDLHGVLQDVHWAAGVLGYFPTYTLGNVSAAQLMQSARHSLPDLDRRIAAGELRPLAQWLGEHVHRHGRRLEPAELIANATGTPPHPAAMLEYLHRKYAAIYGLSPPPA